MFPFRGLTTNGTCSLTRKYVRVSFSGSVALTSPISIGVELPSSFSSRIKVCTFFSKIGDSFKLLMLIITVAVTSFSQSLALTVNSYWFTPLS